MTMGEWSFFNSLFSILFSLMGTGKVRTMTVITPSQLIHLISDVRVLQWVVNSFIRRDLYENLCSNIFCKADCLF
jgi:hypothetical protein